jgi:uncharacterized damage-inducible protein DinB
MTGKGEAIAAEFTGSPAGNKHFSTEDTEYTEDIRSWILNPRFAGLPLPFSDLRPYILFRVFAKQLLSSDIRYSAWANQRLLDACSGLSDDEIARDLGISHSSILSTLRHIHDGERVWLDCLRTTPEMGPWVLPQGTPPEPSLDALRRSWPELSSGYRQWLEGVSEAVLEEELRVRLPGAKEPSLARWKILRHELEHSTLHRGQIVGMIRMLGHAPPAIHRLDFEQAGFG